MHRWDLERPGNCTARSQGDQSTSVEQARMDGDMVVQDDWNGWRDGYPFNSGDQRNIKVLRVKFNKRCAGPM